MSIFDPKHEHEVNDLDGYFIIDPITRSITNTTEAKTALMQYDHNSEIFSFAIPRYVEDHDMTISDAVQIHYINSSDTEKQPGLYMVTDIGIDDSGEEEMVVFSWIISQQAIALKGSLQFQIKFICYDSEGSGTPSYIWSTKVFSAINVLPGLNNAEVVVTEYPDILSQLSSELSRINDKINNLPSGGGSGGSGNIDLSDYYTSEVVDGLLAEKANKGDVDDKVGRINEWLEGHEETLNSHQEQIESKLDIVEFTDFETILHERLNDMEGDIADLSDYYSREVVDGLLAEKQDVPIDIEPVYNDDFTMATYTAVDNAKSLMLDALTGLTVVVGDLFDVGHHCYFTFCTGDTITFVNENSAVKWIGDDCDIDGNFTPQPNSYYEVSIMGTTGGYIARVGAC